MGGRRNSGAAVQEDKGDSAQEKEEDEGLGGLGGEEVQQVAPFEPPPLPRRLLAGKVDALEARMEKLESKPEDPRIPLAKARLERAKQDLKVSGRRTTRRLFFSLVSCEERIGKLEAGVTKAKEVVLEKETEVAKAVREVHIAEQELAAAEARLEREKAVYAHRGFEAAAETSLEVDGFEELEQSLQQVGQGLAECGRKDCEEGWNHVANFIYRFRRRTYASSEDSEVRDLRSVDSTSTLGVPVPPGGAAPVGARQFLEHTALEEEAMFKEVFKKPATEEQIVERQEGLRRVTEAAGVAAQAVQAAIAGQQGAREEPGLAVGLPGALGQAPVEGQLAIMDAVDHPLPSSSSSQGVAKEPSKKRRGREVQVAGGSTGADVQMEKGGAGDRDESATDLEGGL